jgi:murein DD-endopeptidase MepM/ murein hydrolase activator NlpD
MKTMRNAGWGLLLLAAAPGLAGAQSLPPIPDSSGWGVHVLALAQAPDSSIWAGTYGQGIFVLRKGAGSGEPSTWEHIRHVPDTAAHSISWDFVHAFGFGPSGEIWYGTVGNGWGLSSDGGRTWTNWEFSQLGPEWQYVAPNGIVTRGDTTYIATADGIKVTPDDGRTWMVITDSAGATTATDSVLGRIPNQYVLDLAVDPAGYLWIVYPWQRARSGDGGRTWEVFDPGERTGTLTLAGSDRRRWVRLVDSLRAAQFRGFPADAPAADRPAGPRHTWFRRPISPDDQPYIDQTYRFGSTMGGNFQAHQGVEFNNRDGTPVHAIGDGVVVYSGPAEAGANTVAIRHDRTYHGQYVFSVYYHNTRLLARVGQRVRAGDVIALVGNTGRATNDHLHLEVHVAPTTDSSRIVDPAVRYPPFNVNPELWIAPIPGTGLVAGQVWDAQGQPVPQAHIYGLVKVEPRETPFSFIETYGPRNHSDPAYHEHFAIGSVPPGDYVLGVAIDGRRVFRRIHVSAGKLTWVEFRP